MKLKSGPLSNADKKYIRENFESMPYREIAAHLRRRPEVVEDYIKLTLKKKPLTGGGFDYFRTSDVDGEAAVLGLRDTPLWPQLRMQFNDKELQFFLYQFKKIKEQFRGDILHTEELQIIESIRIEILIHRLLSEQQALMSRRIQLESKLASIKFGPANKDEIDNLQREMAQIDNIANTYIKSHKDLVDKKSDFLQKMKATRQDRIKHLENSKESMVQWVSKLIENPQIRKEIGLEIEKFRIAVELEKVRLSRPHQYEDKVVDLPLLSAETIEMQEKEE